MIGSLKHITGWLKGWRQVPVLTVLILTMTGASAAAQEPSDSFVESLFVLGETYEAGEWVRQSDLLAYMWYLLATTAGHGLADPARHRMATRLSPAEIAAAQALARQCHTSEYWRCGEATTAEDLARDLARERRGNENLATEHLATEHLATGHLARTDTGLATGTAGGSAQR